MNSSSPSPTDDPAAAQPHLLVSVRDVAEAQRALAGGCDLLDIKEPSHGSLGMADLSTIVEVFRSAKTLAGSIPVSAALGELSQWMNADSVAIVPVPLDYVKLGLSHCGCVPNWPERWREVRSRFQPTAGSAVQADPLTRWIAVVYVDWQIADAPSPDEVVEHAVAEASRPNACAGVLFDTYSKSGRSLLDWIGGDELGRLAERIREHRLRLALAGGLSARMLPSLRQFHPDIIAIRGAACEHGERNAEISTEAVRSFRSALRADPKRCPRPS